MKRIVLLAFFVFTACFSVAQQLNTLTIEKTGKVGFVDMSGYFMIDPKFDGCYADFKFVDSKENTSEPVGFATVEYKGKWGCINRRGEFIVKPVFKQAEEAHKLGEEWQRKNPGAENGGLRMVPVQDPATKKWGFNREDGKEAVKALYDEYYTQFWNEVENKPEDLAAVKIRGKWGCVNRLGDVVVPPTFASGSDACKAGRLWIEDMTYEGPVEIHSEVEMYLDSNAQHTKTTVYNKNSTTYTTSYTDEEGRTSDNMTVVFNVPQTSQNVTVIAPKITIISPSSGSSYDKATVTIKYDVSTANNIPYDVIVSINGERIEAATMKGVKRVSNEVSVALPRTLDKPCNVQLVAKDTNGNSSEPVTVALNYTGEKPKPNLLLFAVGVSEYGNQGLRLKNAANDARDFVSAIHSMNKSMYANIKVSSLLLNGDATYLNIRKGMSQVVRDAAQDDVVIFFFSGHGSVEENRTYFLPVDVDAGDLFATGINFDDITASAKRLKDKDCKVFIIMDACHSGALLGMKSAFALEMSAPGISILSSSTGNQQSKEYPDWRNGVFTKYLLDGLKGDASDAEGNITIDNLGFYVRKKVSEKDASQSPLYNNEQRNFILFEKSK